MPLRTTSPIRPWQVTLCTLAACAAFGYLDYRHAPLTRPEALVFLGLTASLALLAYRFARTSDEDARAAAAAAAAAAEAERLGEFGHWSWDARSGAISWSPALFRLLGWSGPNTPTYAENLQIFSPASASLLDAAVQRALQDGEPYELELERIDADGVLRIYMARGETVRDDSGAIAGLRGTLQDITPRAVAERARAVAEERWQLALAGSRDGIWDWDIVTGRAHFSDRWLTMLGYAPDELPRRVETFRGLIHADDLPAVEAALTAHLTRADDAPYAPKFRMRRKDGSWAWVLARGQALWDAEGRPVRMAGSHTDISEQVRYEQELQAAREAALASSRAKTEFLSVMSHEIRTPMHGISTSLQLLAEETTLTGTAREYAELARHSAQHLLALLDDILDYSKIEAGRLTLEQAPMVLGQVLQDSVGMFRAAAETRGLTLTLAGEARLPAVVMGDALRLRQILANLIGNAVKFTERGGVTVRAEAWALESGWSVHIDVRDTGVGIAPDRLEHLFEPFTQADSSTARRHGGSGLGLAIVRRLVTAMEGTVSVTSVPGEGTTFSLVIPFRVPAVVETESEAVATLAAPASLEGRRILVAEDNSTNQILIRRALQAAGAVVTLVADGEAAVDAVHFGEFDLVLMDCQMPVMDGITAARILRERGATVPIIALTANVAREDREACLAAGMNGVLAKPMDIAQLRQAVGEWSARAAAAGPAVRS